MMMTGENALPPG